MTAREFWGFVLPELFGEVEIDLAEQHLIADLDAALDSRPWHFIRQAILRLADIDGTWVRKKVADVVVRRGRPGLPDQDGGLQDH